MKEFLKAYKGLSESAAVLLVLGVKLALCVLALGIGAYKYNEWFIGGYQNRMFSLHLVRTAWNIFVIFILGGLALDCFERSTR